MCGCSVDASEEEGLLPGQFLATYVALLPKPTFGNRPIGWDQSVFHVWIKARSILVKRWEQTHTAKIGSAADKGRSPIDVVWQHTRSQSAN